MIQTILKFPNPKLRQETTEVQDFEPIPALAADLIDTMYAQNGAGIAAPQIGRSERVFVIEESVAGTEKPLIFVNPKITEKSEETLFEEEGCLSFPDALVSVGRSRVITVCFHDQYGKIKTLGAHGFLARAIQHELEHLDGKLIFDHASYLKKRMLRKRATTW